jgi:glycosyltransferase involved in cell wall biosynthesis
MSAIEATAMGLPIIATNDGGIPETLVGQHHILIDINGKLPQQIADAIQEIKKDPMTFAGNSLHYQFKNDTYTKSFFNVIGSYFNIKTQHWG